MEYETIDIQKIIEQARAQRAAALGKMLGNGIFFVSVALKKGFYSVAATALNVWESFVRFNEAWTQSASAKMRDDYFAGSANLAELEMRQRKWEQDNFSRGMYV